MLKKLSSPKRKENRLAASPAAGGSQSDEGEDNGPGKSSSGLASPAAEPKTTPPVSSAAESPSKSKKKKATTAKSKKASNKPLESAPPASSSTAPSVPGLQLPTAEPKDAPSEASSAPPLVRSPRTRALLDEQAKNAADGGGANAATTGDGSAQHQPPLMRTPRSRGLLERATSEAKGPTTAPPPGIDDGSVPFKSPTRESKRDRESSGLRGLLKRGNKGGEGTQGSDKSQLTTDDPEAKAGNSSKRRSKDSDNVDAKREPPVDDGKRDDGGEAPLSPIRRRPRATEERDNTVALATTTTTVGGELARRHKPPRVIPPATQPEMHMIGEIESGEGFGSLGDGYCCKWSVDCGNHWTHIAGDLVGQTQIDYAEGGPEDGGSEIIWAHPLDLHFATSTFHGWPKLLLQVWRVDSHMKMNVVGYGFIHLPFSPGFHVLNVSMWRPMGSGKQELEAQLLGHTPELVTDDVLFNSAWAERCRLKTIATGRVRVSIGIILRNFQTLALDM